MVVRELITVLGFKTQEAGLKKYAGALSMIGGFAVAAAAAVAAAGVWMVKSGGEMEQNMIAFETILGGTEAANKLMDEITKFAATTPFEKTELIGYAKSMLGVGFAANEVIPTMRMLGDIASGVGKEKLPNIVLAFNKMKSKGRASLEELWPIVEAGVPIMDQLSKDLNMNKADIMKMASDGKLSFEQVNSSMNKVAQNKFLNLMDKQSKSFLGKVSNIIDMLTNFATVVGTKILPIVSDFADYFMNAFGGGQNLMVDIMVALFTELGMVAAYVVVTIEEFIKAFGQIPGSGGLLKKSLLFVIQMIFINIKILMWMLTKFAMVLGWVIGKAIQFGKLVKKVWSESAERAVKMGERINDVWISILETIRPVLNLIIAIFRWVWNQITAYIMFHVNIWKTIFYTIVDIIKFVVNLVTPLFTWLFDKIAANIQETKDEFMVFGKALYNFFNGIATTILGVFTTVYNTVSSIIAKVTDFLGGKVMSAFRKAQEFFGSNDVTSDVAGDKARAAANNTKNVSYVANPVINVNGAIGTEEQKAAAKREVEQTAKIVYQSEMRKLASNSPSVDYTNKPAYGY